MSERRRIGTSAATATLVAVVLLGIRPVSGERIVVGYVLALATIALAALVRAAYAAAESEPSAFERALEPRREAIARPPELVRTEREIVLGSTSSGHFYARLRPILVEAAAARLAAHHSVDLRGRPERARELLGEEAWAVVRPDLAKPQDLYAPGLSLRRLRVIVERLESL